MMLRINWHWFVLAWGGWALTACGAASPEDVAATQSSEQSLSHRTRDGAVFTMSNATAGNKVLAFARDDDGMLMPAGEYATNGMGTGASLGSQGAVTLSSDNRFLLVVNAGSNDISVFAVHGTRLSLMDKVSTGGMMPTSVAERDHLVYVLNAGSPANISGFWLDLSGRLHAIAHSTRALSMDAASPAEVEIAPNGLGVVVTEKGTNSIDTFALRRDGSLDAAVVHASSGGVPYGFDFAPNGVLVVSEAAPGAVSSYTLNRRGGFTTVSASLSDMQKAPCWLVVSKDGRFAYTANAGSESISGYSLALNGKLQLFNDGGVTASTGTGSKPLDLAFDLNHHLYAVDAGHHLIDGYQQRRDGSLMPITSTDAMPDSIVGIAAY